MVISGRLIGHAPEQSGGANEKCAKPHPLSKHAGLPVERGEKWAFNLWVREFEVRRSAQIYRSELLLQQAAGGEAAVAIDMMRGAGSSSYHHHHREL